MRICSALSGSTSPDIALYVQVTGILRFLMPECIYSYPGIYVLDAPNMIISGNSSFLDPISRLGSSFIGLTTLVLNYGVLVPISGDKYTINWTTAFAVFPHVTVLELQSLQLYGTLPTSLPAGMFRLLLSSNYLSGTFPSTLLPSITNTLSTFYLSIIGNVGISGTLSENLFGDIAFPQLVSMSLELGLTSISGNLPNPFPSSMPRISTNGFRASFDNTQLSGTISSTMLPTLLAMNFTGANPLIIISCQACPLTGSWTLPDAPNGFVITPYTPSLILSFTRGPLSTINIGSNTASYLRSLLLLDMPNLKLVQLASLFTSPQSTLVILLIQNCPFVTGNMPNLDGTAVGNSLTDLELQGTSIQFCTPGRSTWTTTGICYLTETTAYYCPELYPNCSTSMPAPALAPTALPVMPPVGCLEATKPTSGDFQCINGAWTSVASVDVPQFVIPAGIVDTITVVIGNVSSSSVVFSGLGNTLEIHGCASNLSEITVTLQIDDLGLIENNATLKQILLTLDDSGSGCTNLSNIAVVSNVAGSTCKKVSMKTSTQGTQLVALFSVSSTDCNGKSKTWWIVLVAVLCSLVIIAAVVLVLVFTLNTKARNWIRPYSKGRPEHPTL